MNKQFLFLAIVLLTFALIGLVCLGLLCAAAFAGGRDPLVNGGFENGVDGWSVESNPAAFNVDCRFEDSAEGNCHLQAGVMRGTDDWVGINSLVQTIDTSACANPHLIFWWDFYNDSPDPEQDRVSIFANDVLLFQRWNGEGVGRWQRGEVDLPAGQVKLAIVSRVVWRLHMTYMKVDGVEVTCPADGDLIPWAYLPQVGSAPFGPPTPTVPAP